AQIEIERSDGLAEKLPVRCLVRAGGLCQAENCIDLVVGHRRVEGRKSPTLLNQPMVQVDCLAMYSDLDITDQPSIGVKHLVGVIDLGEHPAIQGRRAS